MDQFKTRDPLRLYCAMGVAPHIRTAFSRAGARPPEAIDIRFTRAGNPPHDVLIERGKNRFTFVLEADCSRLFTRSMRSMVGAYAYWLSLADPKRVNSITVNASDGDRASNARFAPSVRFPQHIALPDPHFFEHLGFAAERNLAASAPAWGDRSPDLVWRGGANGNGWMSLAPEDAGNPAVLQRLRLVMLAQSLPDTDIKLVSLPHQDRELTGLARRKGLIGAPVAAASWLGRKYALDIDGYTNTWSNLLVRMLFGCCALKVQSQFGYRQWYYDDIRPFEHFVPVRADLGDLPEKLDWVRSNDGEARAIAERGRALALSLTFESQARWAAGIIENRAS